MKLLIVTQKIDKDDDVLGFTHEWVKKLAEQFETIIVICLKKGHYDLPDNVSVLSLGKERGVSRIKYLINFYRYIYNYHHEYDAVFVHMNPQYVLLGGPLWCLWGKTISLWYAHGRVTFVLRLAEKLADIIFSSTKEGFRLSSKKIKIIGQGIDTEKFKPIDSDIHKEKFKIVTVGRISQSKDYETLISAIDILKDLNISVRIIGAPSMPVDEQYLVKLKTIVIKKNIDQVVYFVGPVPNRKIAAELQSSDLFVNMSHTGSLDKAILEAMACGVPVLTCNEALSGVLGELKGLLMYSKRNSKELAEKIELLYNMNQEDKKRLSEELRNIVTKNHNLDNLAKNIANALQEWSL